MVVALVGDVVASRRFVDQVALLRALADALQAVNEVVTARQPLQLDAGDEFRGTYATLGQAVEATLRLRLAVGDVALQTTDGEDEPMDVRVGLGLGDVVMDDASAGQSGSAWWRARSALEAAFELPRKSKWPPSLRTVLRGDDDVLQAAINATLLCQDQLFARMDARDRRALLGLLDGERQVDVAAELGVTQPAIARRLRERGALAIARGLDQLHGKTAP